MRNGLQNSMLITNLISISFVLKYFSEKLKFVYFNFAITPNVTIFSNFCIRYSYTLLRPICWCQQKSQVFICFQVTHSKILFQNDNRIYNVSYPREYTTCTFELYLSNIETFIEIPTKTSNIKFLCRYCGYIRYAMVINKNILK